MRDRLEGGWFYPRSHSLDPLILRCPAQIFSHLEQLPGPDQSSDNTNLRLMPYSVEKLMRNEEDGKLIMKVISNEVAAAALAAFSSAIYRRPPTKHVEGIMCANEEPEPPTIDDDLSSALPPPPSLPLPSDITNSTNHLMLCPHHQRSDGAVTDVGGNQQPPPLPPLQRRRRSSTHASTPPSLDVAGDKRANGDPGECDCGGNYDEVEDRDSLFRYACAGNFPLSLDTNQYNSGITFQPGTKTSPHSSSESASPPNSPRSATAPH